MRSILRKELLALGALVAVAACGSDSTGVVGPTAVGNYTAISFVTSGTGGQTNQLAAGSTVQLNLAADKTTSGHLHVAATNVSPAFDADLAGTWQQSGNTVTFDQTADTFFNDIALTLTQDPADGLLLVGNQTFSGTNVKITLKRVP